MIAVDWRRDVRPNPKQLLQQHFDGTDCGDRPHIISNLARDGGAPPLRPAISTTTAVKRLISPNGCLKYGQLTRLS